MNDSLPLAMNRDNTCCFTGHRVVPAVHADSIRQECTRAVRILAENGYRYFLCGGALGFDTMAAQVVLSLAEAYDIHLVLILPCRDQTDKWLSMKNGIDHIREYKRILGLADAVYYIDDFYRDGCMKERNQFMVDHASFCVAYYNGAPRSGTGQTFRMAQKAGIEIYNLYSM